MQAGNQPMLQGLSAAQVAVTVGFGRLPHLPGQPERRRPPALHALAQPAPAAGPHHRLHHQHRRPLHQFVRAHLRAASTRSRPCRRRPDAPDARRTSPGHVQFENVSFGYDNLSAVLTDVDIDAKPGQVIALLGPTGSGKSTVVNLIPRFYDVTGGQITIDGIDVRDVTLDSLRKNIGIVQQDVFLFIGTIRENIAYGRPDATQEDIERAAKAARIHDFIVSLPLRLRGVGGRARRDALGRPEAAHRHRPHAAAGPDAS